MKKLSCHFLQRAVYLAPDELRHCCQRFHVDGVMQGDVVMFPVTGPEDVNWKAIEESKRDLINRINRGERTGCWGCPHLQTKDWPEVEDEKLNVISIENHSRCNMRCSYCSETYYGGKVSDYDLLDVLGELKEEDRISSNLHVAWGGGEPTMAKNFDEKLEFVNTALKPRSQRFFSNAIDYNEHIAALMKAGKASLVTSIDAGSAEVFRKVRGVNQYRKVIANLKRYFDNSPENLVIKYIFTDGNYALEELESFVSDIDAAGLAGANFLISSNFKFEILSVTQCLALVYLHMRLTENGAATCAFDEHVRPRIREVVKDIVSNPSNVDVPEPFLPIIAKLQKNTTNSIEEIVVWGAGMYAHWILDHSVALRDTKVLHFVDSDPEKQGSTFRGLDVLKPDCLVDGNTPILIAASFHDHEIRKQIEEMGIDKDRVLPSNLL